MATNTLQHSYNKQATPFTYTSKRSISSTQQNQIKEYFPPTKEPAVKEVTTAWVHPVYAKPQANFDNAKI